MTSMPQTCCKVEEGMLTAGMQEHAETILPLPLRASLFRDHTHTAWLPNNKPPMESAALHQVVMRAIEPLQRGRVDIEL